LKAKLFRWRTALRGCEKILNDEYAGYDESDLYMIGPISDADKKRQEKTR
jgi:F-type H+/Na+-transporting ATPase subunit beta